MSPEVVDKEHIKDEVFDCSSRLPPGYDVRVGFLESNHGAAFRNELLDPADVFQKDLSLEFGLGNFIQNFFFITENYFISIMLQ